MKRTIVVVVVMAAVAAIPFYRMITNVPLDDHFPPKTTTELLDALELQIVEPEGYDHGSS